MSQRPPAPASTSITRKQRLISSSKRFARLRRSSTSPRVRQFGRVRLFRPFRPDGIDRPDRIDGIDGTDGIDGIDEIMVEQLDELYREVILDHFKNSSHRGELPKAQIKAGGNN